MGKLIKDSKNKMKYFVLDVDGVFTNGQFLYTEEGKFAKVFGPHDHDGIKLVRNYLRVMAVTADRRGFKITKKRIGEDMNLQLELVTEGERLAWLNKNFNLPRVIFMGDGMFDAQIFKHVGYSIAPNNAFYLAKERANYVTRHNAGEGAVAEACLHVLEKFFEPFDIAVYNLAKRFKA